MFETINTQEGLEQIKNCKKFKSVTWLLKALAAREVLNGDFNCMGYAFGCLTWLMPIDPYFEDVEKVLSEMEWKSEKNRKCAYQAFLESDYNNFFLREICIKRILKRFSNVRLIKNFSELRKNEYGIVFATGENDFHFGRYEHKEYSHKLGECCIEFVEKEDDIFGKEYDSPRHYFAVKRV